MEFSKEQQNAYNKYLEGKNIFITGPGGTGKTALIRHIQKDAYKKCIDIQVCALTGCAAVLLQCKAKTVHSWAGIGLGNGTIEQIVNKILKNKYIKATWKGTDILVVDEVSMMSLKLFEMLDAIAKAVRKNPKPFGGLQVIFSGDFYQLPPVGTKDEPDTTKFCFESSLWFETFKINDHISLNEIFRQNDPIYQRILNQIREGRLKRSSNEILLQHVDRVIDPSFQIRPTKLFPTRNKVDYINVNEMNKLTGKEYEYKIKYHSDLEMSASERTIRIGYTKEQIQQTPTIYIESEDEYYAVSYTDITLEDDVLDEGHPFLVISDEEGNDEEKPMNYAQLLKGLKVLSKEQLQQTLTIYIERDDEYYSVSHTDITLEDDVLNEGHFFLVISDNSDDYAEGGEAGELKNVSGNAFYITDTSVENADKDFDSLSDTFFSSKDDFENNMDAIQEFSFNVNVKYQYNINGTIKEYLSTIILHIFNFYIFYIFIYVL